MTHTGRRGRMRDGEGRNEWEERNDWYCRSRRRVTGGVLNRRKDRKTFERQHDSLYVQLIWCQLLDITNTVPIQNQHIRMIFIIILFSTWSKPPLCASGNQGKLIWHQLSLEFQLPNKKNHVMKFSFTCAFCSPRCSDGLSYHNTCMHFMCSAFS